MQSPLRRPGPPCFARSSGGPGLRRGDGGRNEAGFTLLELIISLGLFALIAVAGLALLDSVMTTQQRTEGRLDRMATIQRTMFVIQSDLDQVTRGPISGGGAEIGFTRIAPGMGGPPVPVRYAGGAGALVRAAPQPQPLLDGVAGVRWRFLDGQKWVDRWPPDPERKDEWPRAVAVEMQLSGARGPAGGLRRVVALPAQAKERPQ